MTVTRTDPLPPEVVPDPGPLELGYCRLMLARAGYDSTNRSEVVTIAHLGVTPTSLVAAARQLSVTFECRGGCGGQLDPAEVDAFALELCGACLEDAEMENEHADGGHVHGSHPDCPDCPGGKNR